jgi:tetratricopeptide (TPR) repeat protein
MSKGGNMNRDWAMRVVALAMAAWMGSAASAQDGVGAPHADEIRALRAAVAAEPGQASAAEWLRLAVFCQDAARYKESEEAYRRAVGLVKSNDRASVAQVLDHMGTMYVETGRFAKAEPLEQKALAIWQSLNDTKGIGTSFMHLAMLSIGKHDMDAAEADAEMAVSVLAPMERRADDSSAATPEEQMAALIDLSLVRCGRGACANAIPTLTRALTIAEANYAHDSVPVGFSHFLLGYANWKSGNETAAAELMKAGTAEMESQLGWGHPTYIAALKKYEGFLKQNGQGAAALEVGARIAGLEKGRRAAPSDTARVALSLDQLP